MTPASEFDYRDVVMIQLEAILSPFVDSRRGVHTDGFVIFSDMPLDSGGRLVARLSVEYQPDRD